jgi:REP element-mobilizing transposase RayT
MSGWAIFRGEHDYEGFLDRLGRCSRRFGLGIFAYMLMGNHYHLLVKTHEANLSAAMRREGVTLHISQRGIPGPGTHRKSASSKTRLRFSGRPGWSECGARGRMCRWETIRQKGDSWL